MPTLAKIVLFAFALSTGGTAVAAPCLRTLAEAMDDLGADTPAGCAFAFTGTVTHVAPNADPSQGNRVLLVQDGATYGYVRCRIPQCPQPGSVVHLDGHTEKFSNGRKFLQIDTVSRLGTVPLPSPVETTGDELLSGRLDYRLVSIRGFVIDVTPDDIDTKYEYLTISCGSHLVLASRTAPPSCTPQSPDLIGARVRLTGICRPAEGDSRLMIEHLLELGSSPDAITVLTPANADPFDAPALGPHDRHSLKTVVDSGRRRVRGRVLACWGKRRFLLKPADSASLAVTLRDPGELPHVGESVTAVGYPDTDLFWMRLTGARCRTESGTAAPSDERPSRLEPRDLLEDAFGNNQFHAGYNGKLVRLRGIVRRLAPDEGHFTLECGRHQIPVDATSASDALPTAVDRATVDVTGYCLLETDSWRPSSILPRIQGLLLVPRTADDIRLVSLPPWWTPVRLALVIGILMAALLGFLIWNRALNRVVNRKTRELLKEQIANASAQLRIDERTRLAAELHDSLSQNLSGIACQLNAAKLTLEGDSETRRLLQTAERMLQSSRTELTRCIWDLRGDTLEEPDFAAAIRKTLDALALPAEIAVRFNVPRTKVSDSTAHAILCIVRELVTNAVRHGRATSVRIAGGFDREKLLFSVRDNGCGFDPMHHPDVADGHFGLAGIRDRVIRLSGTFDIVSRRDCGTDARISIPVSHPSSSGQPAI